jgi:PAS domain S-box-containing protein
MTDRATILGMLERPPALIELLPVAVYACDAAGRIRWFNARAAALWGRQPDLDDPSEVFCGSLRLYDPAGRALGRWETPMAQALAEGRAIERAEAVVERPNGTRIVVLAQVQPLLDDAGAVLGGITSIQDVTALKQAEDQLRDRGHAQRELLEALPVAVCTTDAEGRLSFFNQAAVELWGHRPALGGEPFAADWRERSAEGAEIAPGDCAVAMALRQQRALTEVAGQVRRPDGRRIPVLGFPTPLRDASGAITGAVNMLVDISASKRAENRQKALIDELNHRVKNTLATVQSLALQTFRGKRPPDAERASFEGRLLALSRAHDLLTASRWEAAELPALLLAVMAAYRDPAGERLRIAGPPVPLPPRVALTLAIVLHELATNAAKYGALSVPEGSVTVDWQVIGAPERLSLVWRERGGPPAQAPERQGFGTRFIQRALEAELSGLVRFDYGAQGLVCELELPLGER